MYYKNSAYDEKYEEQKTVVIEASDRSYNVLKHLRSFDKVVDFFCNFDKSKFNEEFNCIQSFKLRRERLSYLSGMHYIIKGG